MRQALGQKGVAPEIVSEVIESRYGQTNEEALAREHLERKRIRRPENEKETARVMRRLVAAGFSTGTIYKILRQWNVPDESLAALDSAKLTSRTENNSGADHRGQFLQGSCGKQNKERGGTPV